MATTESEILNRLAEIQRTIQGVRHAFGSDDVPNKLQTAHLPAFVNVPGPSEHEFSFGNDAASELRTYRMMLYVAPVERPSDVAKRMQRVMPYFRRVFEKFKSLPLLDSLDDIGATEYLGDDGLDVLEYAGEFFCGIEFKIDVVQYF